MFSQTFNRFLIIKRPQTRLIFKPFSTNSHSTNVDASLKPLFKKFILKIHPDFFHTEKKLQKVNQTSLQSLNSVLESMNSVQQLKDVLKEPREFSFYVRHLESGDDTESQPIAEKPPIQLIKVKTEPLTQEKNETVIQFKLRTRYTTTKLVTDLLTKANVLSKDAEQALLAKYQPKKSATKAQPSRRSASKQMAETFFDSVRDYMFTNTFVDPVFEKVYGNNISDLEPHLRLKHMIPLLHKDSVASPLVSSEMRRDTVDRLKLHLVELGFDLWHELPVMITLGNDVAPQTKQFEKQLLKELGKGFVLIPVDFDRNIEQLRKKILAEKPKIQKEIGIQEQSAEHVRSLLHKVANHKLGFVSVSIESPLLLCVPLMRMLTRITPESVPELFDSNGYSLLRGLHLSVVDSTHANQAATNADVSLESDRPVFDLPRHRLCIPYTITDASQLQEFMQSKSAQRMLTFIHTTIKHFQLVEQNYNKLKRALERVLQLTSIVLDETLFETKYGPLPPRIEKSKSGCMITPISNGPMLSEHAATQRHVIRKAFTTLQCLSKNLNEFAKIFRHDCTGVVMMLSNVYASELMTREQSDAVRAQLSTSLIPAETGVKTFDRIKTAMPQQNLVLLKVPVGSFDIDELRKNSLSTHARDSATSSGDVANDDGEMSPEERAEYDEYMRQARAAVHAVTRDDDAALYERRVLNRALGDEDEHWRS